VDDYISAVRKMACDILELVTEGLGIEPRDALSRLLSDEKSFKGLAHPLRPWGGSVTSRPAVRARPPSIKMGWLATPYGVVQPPLNSFPFFIFYLFLELIFKILIFLKINILISPNDIF
jgi:hypothetical protein